MSGTIEDDFTNCPPHSRGLLKAMAAEPVSKDEVGNDRVVPNNGILV